MALRSLTWAFGKACNKGETSNGSELQPRLPPRWRAVLCCSSVVSSTALARPAEAKRETAMGPRRFLSASSIGADR